LADWGEPAPSVPGGRGRSEDEPDAWADDGLGVDRVEVVPPEPTGRPPAEPVCDGGSDGRDRVERGTGGGEAAAGRRSKGREGWTVSDGGRRLRQGGEDSMGERPAAAARPLAKR